MKNNLPCFFKDPHSLAALPASTPVLLGLSGGADSVTLLHLLCRLREQSPFPLYAAHVNHGIRTEEYGNEAMRDERFCMELCEKFSVTLFVEHIDVPALVNETATGLEGAARDARYSCFSALMTEHNIPILVTAHNANDNLETQIFNLCRGCGIDGICGIPEVRPLSADSDKLTVRPILSASRAEILTYCEENRLEYVTDSTNLSDDCTRNRIRHHIIPQLQSLFQSPEKSGLRLSRTATEDNDYLSSVANELFLRYESNGSKIPQSELQNLHPAVLKRLFQMLFAKYSYETPEAVHLEALLLLAKSQKNAMLSLPGKIRAVSDGGFLHFEADAPSDEKTAPFCIKLRRGFTVINEIFAISIESDGAVPTSAPESEFGYRLFASAFVRNTDIDQLTAANRQSGDKIRDGGVGKRIKKLMCDKKIDIYLRNLLPIVREGDEPIYVPLCALADRVRADEQSYEYQICIYARSI